MEDNQTFVATDKNWIPWEDAKCEESTYSNPENVQTANNNENATNIFSTSAEKHQVECSEKFGDSLHQLNKIVERISPDSSAANYQNFSTSFGNKIHNLNSRLRSSYGSSYTDSITDSAYETCVGDNSFDCPNDEQYMSHLRDQIDIYDSRNMRSWPPPPQQQQQQQPPNDWSPDMRSMPMKVQPLSLSLCAKDIYNNSNANNNFHISNSLPVNDDNDFSVCNMDKSYKLQNMDKDYSILTSQSKMLYSPEKPPLKKSKPLNEQQHHSVGTPTLQNQHHHHQHQQHHHSVEDNHIIYESDTSKQLEWGHHHQNSTSYLELDKYNDHHMESNMTSFDKNIIGKSYSRCTNSVDDDNNTGNNMNNTILSTESKDANLSDCNMNADSRNSSDDEDGRCDNDGSGKQIFTCTHCNFGARKKGQLRKHMSMHGIFLCAHCEFSSEIADVLEDHRKVSHPGLCGRKLCKKCRVLYQGDELEEHERLCSGEKQNWICPICQKEFKFLSVMKAHARKWHPNETNALMSSSNVLMTPGLQMECSWRMSAADSTTGEMTPENENSNRARSNSDEFLSSSDNHNSYYAGHPNNNKMMDMKQHGDNNYNMYCKPDKLKKPYIQMESSKKYMSSNMNVGGRGENCGDACSNEDGPPLELAFYCDHENCCTTFRSDKELNVHRMSIHGMPPKRYHCRHPDCSMQFAKFGHYKRHQLSHAGGGEKKFRCDWPNCGKAFCHTDNLKVHYRRHTDEKPYKCDKCASSYRQKSGLKYHLEKAHDEKSTGKPGRKRKNLLPNLSAESPDYSMLSNKYDTQESAYKKSLHDVRKSQQQQHSNSQMGYDSSGFSSPCLSTGNKGTKHHNSGSNNNRNNNNNNVNNDDDLNNSMSYHGYYSNHSHEELKSMQKHKLVDESNHHHQQQQQHHPHHQQQHMHGWNAKSFSPPVDMMMGANSLYGKPPPGFMGMGMERPPPMDHHNQMYPLKMDRHLNNNQQQQPNYYTDDKGNSNNNNNNNSSNGMYCNQPKQSDMSMRFIEEHNNSIESNSHHMFNMSPNMPKQLHHSRSEDHWNSYQHHQQQQHQQHEMKSLKHMDRLMPGYPRSDKNNLMSNYGDDDDDDDDDNDNSNDEEQYDNCNNNSSSNNINTGSNNNNRINNDDNDDNIDNNVNNNNNSNESIEHPGNLSNNHDIERDDESKNLRSRERIGGLPPQPNLLMDDKIRLNEEVLDRDGNESARERTFALENERQSKFSMLRNMEDEEEENDDVRNSNSTKGNINENNENVEDGDGNGVGNDDNKGSSTNICGGEEFSNASARNTTPIVASLSRIKKESFNDDNDYNSERDERCDNEDHDRNDDNDDGDDDDNRVANKHGSGGNRNQDNGEEEEEDANKTWTNNETSPNVESQPLSSTSMAKGWPRILDASLTESNNSFHPLDPTKNIFGSSGESATSETGGLFKPLDPSRIRSVDPIPGFGMFGMTQSYQPANDYPIPAPSLTSRPPIINDNYYLGSQSSSNLPYGNMYNFPRRHPANQLESPFNGFQSTDRYSRPPTESDYRDQTLRLGSTYGFLHSSPYPYDHRPYANTQEASSSFMPTGYDFSYAPSSLPPFPPPPPPTFSLTRPWAGTSNDLDLFPGVDSSKSQRSPYQSSPYGGAQSSSATNRYF